MHLLRVLTLWLILAKNRLAVIYHAVFGGCFAQGVARGQATVKMFGKSFDRWWSCVLVVIFMEHAHAAFLDSRPKQPLAGHLEDMCRHGSHFKRKVAASVFKWLAASGRKRGYEEKGSGNQCHQYFLSQPKALLFSKESRLRAPPACLVCHHDTTTLLVTSLPSISLSAPTCFNNGLPLSASCSHDCPMLFPFH